MKVGIFGPPGSGKTTVFRCLTGIQPSVGQGGKSLLGTVKVPDERLEHLATIFRPKKVTPAEMILADLPGSADGKVDSRLAAELRTMDVLTMVLAGFVNPLSSKEPEPVGDFENLENELILADLGVVENRLQRIAKEHSPGTKNEEAVLRRCLQQLEEARPLRTLELSVQETSQLKNFQLLSLKKLIVLLNTDEKAPASCPRRLEEKVQAHGATVFSLSAKLEAEIMELAAAERAEFLQDIGQSETARERYIKHAYRQLGLISFLTVGPDECRAWTIRSGTSARAAAGVIHSDIERGFIRAEVVSYSDFVSCGGSESAARAAGRYRLEGKDYPVQDGDIINFRFNV